MCEYLFLCFGILYKASLQLAAWSMKYKRTNIEILANAYVHAPSRLVSHKINLQGVKS